MRPLKSTLVLRIDPKRPAQKSISFCAKVVRAGGLVAFPTETVYGIAANMLDSSAMRRLCRVKARPRGKPFTVHIADIKLIKKMGCRITKEAQALIARFWPGPLTILLRSKAGRKVGFRMPANKVALELIRNARVPVVAPSANMSGERPPRNSRDVLKSLCGKVDVLLDAGTTTIGVESTVVDMAGASYTIMREGAISRKAIAQVIGNG